MRRQEPGVTRPRPPTVAEARARDKAIRRQEELAAAKAAADEKRRKRNRRLIGGAAVVGVVGVVALIYVSSRPDTVTAHCIRDENGQEVVVDDHYCSGSPGMGGIFIFGGHQYRYYYGGNSTIGQRPTGGSTVLPKGVDVKTKSGTVIQRGGFGSKIGKIGS
ncbi:hypothetical protein FOS14_04770 [Skermania sp. ID1734]|uniref:hypothetical protein n=1 Tax=Skermania sp. ID1734 TaxID=2597516 RepID=UPI00117D1817|nr:hypothetical protein FOS14_04770 [Skermania sp. ID1734]